MKLYLKYIFPIIFLAIALLSCDRSGVETVSLQMDLAPTEVGATRAMLTEESFVTSGNALRVYDYYTPSGQGSPYYYFATSNANQSDTNYGSDVATYNGSSWPFANKHEWTSDGMHKFFGWLDTDNNFNPAVTAKGFFGNDFTFDRTNQTLTIPPTSLAEGSTQFDFMYSNIVERDLNGDIKDYSQIPLAFSHLFTAFKITATDTTKNDVWLSKVTISGLKTTRGATISYLDTNQDHQPEIAFTSATETSSFVYDLTTDGRYNVVTQGAVTLGVELDKTAKTVTPDDKNIEGDDFILMWPHSITDFSGAEIVVDYNYSEAGTLHLNCQTIIKMDDLKPWKSGQKNVIGLMFCDKTISLDCTVEPWEKKAEVIEFTNQISVSQPMTWQSKTIEDISEEEGKVYLYSDTEICAVCNFHIDTPKGATWTASIIPVEGSADAFVIEDGTKYGYVGVDSEIKIRVRYNKPIQGRNAAILRITVQTADMRTIIANLMPSKVNDDVTEYMLIQNLING